MEKLTMPAGLAKRLNKSSKPKKEAHLHSAAHALADELSQKFGEPKRFGFYLRMAMIYNHDFLRRIAGQILESSTAKKPGALFAYLVKKEKDQLQEIPKKL
jgi:hypothetical protein